MQLPENARHLPNTVPMLVHRLRRWANIKTVLGECPMFAGSVDVDVFAPTCAQQRQKGQSSYFGSPC